jgi:2,3-bisphosphoglycerate-independent phosphoglycerate mutase
VSKSRKYAIILPDGAADEPVVDLDGRTPLEAARTPNIDWVSSNGRQGRVQTVPKGFSPGSDVATLSLFGYDPNTEYSGRAPLEAAARGIAAGPDQMIFRCNFVTVVDGLMADFTAGHIGQTEADRLIADLNAALSESGCRFHAGVSYRNLMVATVPGDFHVRCTPPHDIPDQPVKDHAPRGRGADWVKQVADRARDVLRDHDVNHVRSDLGDNPATDIWLWGQGRPRPLEPFAERFGLSGAVIAAVDLIRGIARSVGMKLIDVPGATGYLDTNYQGKGAAAVAALDEYDLVIVHIEAPDEAGHLGDTNEKIKAIEQVDEHIVGPMLDNLRRFDAWRMLIAPDHPTPVGRRIHTSTPPPFCFAGSGVQTVMNRPFSESAAVQSDLFINPGHELMEFFLRP